jgi:hypothetical protein
MRERKKERERIWWRRRKKQTGAEGIEAGRRRFQIALLGKQ